MNDYKLRFLRLLSVEPRKFNDFTHGGSVHAGISPGVVAMYLSQLESDGLIEQKHGRYVITQLGIAALAQAQIVPGATYGNHSMPPGSYEPPKWEPVRAGADDHKQFSSRGLG